MVASVDSKTENLDPAEAMRLSLAHQHARLSSCLYPEEHPALFEPGVDEESDREFAAVIDQGQRAADELAQGLGALDPALERGLRCLIDGDTPLDPMLKEALHRLDETAPRQPKTLNCLSVTEVSVTAATILALLITFSGVDEAPASI